MARQILTLFAGVVCEKHQLPVSDVSKQHNPGMREFLVVQRRQGKRRRVLNVQRNGIVKPLGKQFPGVVPQLFLRQNPFRVIGARMQTH